MPQGDARQSGGLNKEYTVKYYLYNLPSWLQFLPPTLCRWLGHRPAPDWTEYLSPGQGVGMTCLRCEAGLGRLPTHCEPEDVECYRDEDGRLAYRMTPQRAAQLGGRATRGLVSLSLTLCLLAVPTVASAMGEKLPRCYELEQQAVLADGVCRQRNDGTLCLTKLALWEDLAEGRCSGGIVEDFRRTYRRKLEEAGLERRSDGHWKLK